MIIITLCIICIRFLFFFLALCDLNPEFVSPSLFVFFFILFKLTCSLFFFFEKRKIFYDDALTMTSNA